MSENDDPKTTQEREFLDDMKGLALERQSDPNRKRHLDDFGAEVE